VRRKKSGMWAGECDGWERERGECKNIESVQDIKIGYIREVSKSKYLSDKVPFGSVYDKVTFGSH